MKEYLRNILFIDIETVRVTDSFDQLDNRMQEAWIKKSAWMTRDSDLTPAEAFTGKASIYAEFGRVVVIGMGLLHRQNDEWILRQKAIYHEDERQLLEEFREVLSRMNQDELMLCAHNGKEFDFPYLSRRMRINRIPLPAALDIAGKKPWEIQHLDTMELWKFGEYKHYTSLDLLAALFGIESSKSDMDGSEVGKTFYKENDPERIMTYCLKDVEVTARLFLHLKGWHDLSFRVNRKD